MTRTQPEPDHGLGIIDETSFEMVDNPATEVESTERASIGLSRKGSGIMDGPNWLVNQ